MLSACTTPQSALDRPQCPSPPPSYLTPPKPISPLPEPQDEFLTAEDVLTYLLNEAEARKVQDGRFRGLQAWGIAECGWGTSKTITAGRF